MIGSEKKKKIKTSLGIILRSGDAKNLLASHSFQNKNKWSEIKIVFKSLLDQSENFPELLIGNLMFLFVLNPILSSVEIIL